MMLSINAVNIIADIMTKYPFLTALNFIFAYLSNIYLES